MRSTVRMEAVQSRPPSDSLERPSEAATPAANGVEPITHWEWSISARAGGQDIPASDSSPYPVSSTGTLRPIIRLVSDGLGWSALAAGSVPTRPAQRKRDDTKLSWATTCCLSRNDEP